MNKPVQQIHAAHSLWTNRPSFIPGFEITTEIVHDSHDFHDKIFVDFLAESTIFDAFLELK